MKKTKWLIYTVLIGLLPILIRLFIFIIRTDLNLAYTLNTIDIVIFGLVLHVSNINELEDKENIDRAWKTTNIGLSVLLLIIFSSILAVGYLSELPDSKNINTKNLKICSIVLSTVSLIMSYSIYNRLNKLNE
jgi:hypothetical protein